MTVAPNVELTFNPTDLRPKDIPWTGRFLGSPSDAIQAGLWTLRGQMINHMKTEVRAIANPTYSHLLAIADLAWKLYMPSFGRVTVPVMADAYIRAYRQADAGDVPISVITELAERHAAKTGDYFHESSRDALSDGFNTMVNRRMPAKAAADRVLDAYGLTPRQMNGYVNNKQLMTPVDSPSPFDVKLRAREYIDKSFTQRVKKLSDQEEHNIEEQAKQLSWMWMQDKGRLTDRAQKIWITASDERVCPVCGPLHGQKVLVKERFKTDQGLFWSPGVHPNCRCVVRLIENRFRFEGEEEDLEKRFDPHQPRGNNGRWSGGQSSGRKLGTKLNRMETPSAKVVENVARHRASIAVNYVKEPRYLTTPIKHRDKEMWKLANGAAAWSRRSENVLRARKMEDPDNEYYANKLKLTRTEKSLDALIKAVHSAPQNSPELYRGVTASSPWKTQSIMPGMIMDLPLSSFTEDRAFSELFARKWGPKIEAARAKRKGYEIGDDAVPMVFVLEPKAQALNISPLVAERQAEWVTRGKFQITSIGVDDNGMGVVHIKQISSKVSKADIWEPEDHPRGGDPENSGRFSRRPRPIPRLAPMAEPVYEEEEEPEVEATPEPQPETKQETKEQWGSPGGWGSPASSQGWGSNAPVEQQGWGSPAPTPEAKKSQGWGSPVPEPTPEAKQSQGWGSPAATPVQGAAKPAPAPAPKEPEKPKGPKGKKQIDPSGKTYYRLIDDSEYGLVQHDFYDEEFTPHESEIIDKVNKARRLQIDEKFYEVCGRGGTSSVVVESTNEAGEHQQAWIPAAQFREMLTTFAYQCNPHETVYSTSAGDFNIPVRWNVGGHFSGEGRVSIADTVIAQGITEDDFIWHVQAVTSGHDDPNLTRTYGQRAALSGSFAPRSMSEPRFINDGRQRLEIEELEPQ